MVRIAIVDDEARERETIREYLDILSEQTQESFSVTDYSSGEAFLFRYGHDVDLIFMDIQFSKGEDGMETARKLRQVDQTVLLIFVTNLAQMAIHGYEVDALDFIVKPIDKYAFFLKTKRALGRISRQEGNSVTITQKGELYSLFVHLIQYLEVDGHYILYHTKEGVFSEYGTLSAAEKKLSDPCFIRPNRSILLNLRHVTKIGKDFVEVGGEKRIDIARPQRNDFKKAYLEYLDGQMQSRRQL